MKQTTEIKRLTEIHLDYRNVNIHNMTNLFLYGTLETPPLEERKRNVEEYDALPVSRNGQSFLALHLDMNGYMTEGPGRYAHASMAPFVERLFDFSQPAPLPDGRYTKEELIERFKAEFLRDADPQKTAEENEENAERRANAEFNIAFKQYDMDRTSADYMERVYLYNSSGFTISQDAVFVIADHGATRYAENMAVHAFHDNFDFHTSNTGRFDWLVQQAEDHVLGDRIDPDGIGRTVQIIFDHKEAVPVIEKYEVEHFREDQGRAEKESSGTLLLHAYPDMNEVVNTLREEGTIGGYEPPEREPGRDVGDDGQGIENHPEIPSDTTVYEPAGASYTFTVPSYDHGEKEKERDDARRDDVGSSSSQHGYVPSVRDHDYRTLFEPYKNDLSLGDRKQLMEDVLAFEQERGRSVKPTEAFVQQFLNNELPILLLDRRYA